VANSEQKGGQEEEEKRILFDLDLDLDLPIDETQPLIKPSVTFHSEGPTNGRATLGGEFLSFAPWLPRETLVH
jgi:hypothetical protein